MSDIDTGMEEDGAADWWADAELRSAGVTVETWQRSGFDAARALELQAAEDAARWAQP
jgi:hypothetical protein